MPRAVHSLSFALVLSCLFPIAGYVQAQFVAGTQRPAPVVYNATNEVVLRGAIAQVITRPAPGLPLGLHLVVSSEQGNVDAHLGPFLAACAGQKGLVAGASVQMVGVMAHLPAGDIFLVRTIVTGGQTIQVRNANGIPVRQVAPTPRVVRGADQKGGLS
jgi:hypothetical protein